MPRDRIYLSPPHMGVKELAYIQEAFDTNWISPAGPHLGLFEQALSEYVNVPHCVALSSGTAAIHLALIELGVTYGDEVVCSSFTFAGSCNPIVYLGAKPVFVDSEPETWNMDPELLRKALSDRIEKSGAKPKAIIVVHLYGMPAKIKEVMKIAQEFDIPVIEDAAEALGSTLDGKKLGSFGDIGVLSFNGNKIITTSGGGAMLSQNKNWIDHARFLSTQARDPAPHYEHSQVGFNYRLSNVCAAIGRGQLEVLDNRVKSRRGIFQLYERELQGIEDLEFVKELPGAVSNRWLTTCLLGSFEQRERIRLALEEENIESRPLWKPMHLQPVFKTAVAYVNGVSEDLFNRGLCLPSGSNLASEELSLIAAVVKKSL